MIEAALTWIEGSGLAVTVRESLYLTAGLSAVHLLGVTLIGGAALISALRLLGILFGDRPLGEIIHPAGRVILLGALISVTTGVLQFTPRALAAVGNSYFQLKLGLLVSALVCQVLLSRRCRSTRYPVVANTHTRLIGVLASLLWIGVIAAGSAFILLE